MMNTSVPIENASSRLFDCFERISTRHPLNVAVKSGGRALTYRDLDETSSRIARYLASHLGAGSRPVAVLMENQADAVAAMLGVLRSGNFYSVLSARNPVPRLKSILEDLDAPLVIVDAALTDIARQSAPETCSMVKFDEILLSPGGRFDCPVSDESLAGVYYTSGSTGEPKGVMRRRSTILARALLEIESLELTTRDRALLMHLLSATASLSTVFSCLLSGGTLVIYEPDRLGIVPLKEFALSERLTIFRITVELLRYFIDSLPEGAYFGDVRIFHSAGDVLYRRDLERMWKHLPPNAVFIHQLAASETSLLARNILYQDTPLDSDIVPVGYPVAGQDVFLLDENRNPVPAGEVGEICLRSDWEFPGYWRRPDLTDEKLIPDPENLYQKIYCSGDLGRFRPDGQLEFIGRRDSRVKIRGFSVDMSAVESVLMSFSDVRRAVVVPLTGDNGHKRLVAYTSPMPGHELDTKILRANTAKYFPDYMIPAAFFVLREFPLTATGKIDRKALPAPDWNELQKFESYTPPANELEEKLAGMWQRALGLQKIGVHDNFFDLGGDSLIASALFVDIERQLGLRLPLAFVVENNTVRRMAGALKKSGGIRGLVALQPEGERPPLFLVPGAYGDALFWRTLLPHAHPDQPMFGVQALRRDGDHLYKYDVEQVAKRFLEDIQAVAPTGPYRLLGYSFGGLIAFEMACRLEAKGECVSFLGLVDTSPPSSHRDASIPVRLRIHASNLWQLSWRKRWKYVKDGFKRQLIRLGRRKAIREAMPVEKFFPNDHRAATTLAIRSYKPQKIFGKDIVVFKALERPWYLRWDRMDGWQNYVAGKVTFHEISGTHSSVVREPNVKYLADAIFEALPDDDEK